MDLSEATNMIFDLFLGFFETVCALSRKENVKFKLYTCGNCVSSNCSIVLGFLFVI